jgi:hypothetical protein
MPVEGWPTQTGTLSLYDWQRDIDSDGGDRHSIIIQPGTGNVWETWQAQLNVSGSSSNWQAANGALWNLNSNVVRPDFWTSADAAGLSMLGGLVRYDECQRGTVEHAVRLIVRSTRRAFIYPATHFAPSSTNLNAPAMGDHLRLKSTFPIPNTWSNEEKAVTLALKKIRRDHRRQRQFLFHLCGPGFPLARERVPQPDQPERGTLRSHSNHRRKPRTALTRRPHCQCRA